MEQHAVPRQITTFEFKLIGFLTIKQFVYLLVFSGFAVLTYFLLSALKPFNIVVAVLIMAVGGFFALFKYNEREIDVWIKNLLTSLLAPSQYYYMKRNEAPDFLKGVFVTGDDAIVQIHIDAKQKLAKYIETTKQTEEKPHKTQVVDALLSQQPPQPASQTIPQPVPDTIPQNAPQTTAKGVEQTKQVVAPPVDVVAFLSGVVHNNRNEALPNIMVYINTNTGQAARILKTNHHGLFATFHPLAPGDYAINPKDLGGKYFFDTMNITVDDKQYPPIQIYSKEVL